MRNSFKNFWKGKKKPLDDDEATVESAAKRRRPENEDTIDAMQEQYDDTVQQLKEGTLKIGETESKQS